MCKVERLIEDTTMKKCSRCLRNGNQTFLKKRHTPPGTASIYKDQFEYWQCPRCKTNYAYNKED
jgi:hypothetical protein